jgi:hypothetical protein
MKEPKPYLLNLVKVFLLLSLGLLATTIYLYIHTGSTKTPVSYNKKKPAVKAVDNTRDSLEKIYSATIKDWDVAFNGIPLGLNNIPENQPASKNPVDKKIADTVSNLEKLRSEINMLLADKSSIADLESAKEKIGELQMLVDDLKNKNIQITKENETLFSMMQKGSISASKKELPEYKPENKNTEEETVAIAKNPGLVFKADNIQVSATASTDFLEKETSRADETNKLIGSFILKNNSNKNTVSEVMIVVLQPDGRVLQTSNWETGIFYTASGKQIYSKKLRFNNTGGEIKKLNFSIEAEKYLPGKYTIELYHDGSIIGRANKILS